MKSEPGRKIHQITLYASGARLFAYWDHEPRMSGSRRVLRQSKRLFGGLIRFHRNQWATARYLSHEMWDPALTIPINDDHP
jgi:hypothetical protein